MTESRILLIKQITVNCGIGGYEMDQTQGRQSIYFQKAPYILGASSVVGKKEGEGPLGGAFSIVSQDDLFGEDCWEKAESEMQKEALAYAIQNAGITKEKIRFLYGGDLLGQLIATSFGLESFEIPWFGIYGACSTCGEALALAAMTIAGNYADYTAAVTSSHFASAEKQFRFPLAYGNQRPLSATWTVTGSGAFILGKNKGHVKISGITAGRVIDYGVQDSMNMGACMAPAASHTIAQNFRDFQRGPLDYDKIITGDLGYVGREILIDLLKKEGYDISQKHMDCGIEIYDQETQDTHAGGSGCGCSAAVLSALILPNIQKGIWKNVLFVPTGALLSPVSFNEGQSVPGIAHGIVLEYCE